MKIYDISNSKIRPRVTSDYVIIRKETATNIELEKLKGGGGCWERDKNLSHKRIPLELFNSELAKGKIVEVTYTFDASSGIIKIYKRKETNYA